MALYPAAIKKLIPAGSNDPRIVPRAVILHVADMLGPSLWDYFAHRSGGIESHFYIRLDGTVEQYRDTGYQADANYMANDFAVSVETEGHAAGEWTAAQLTSIQRLLLWLNTTDKIPLHKIQAWDGSGVGYHTLFGAPSKWTPVAKSCPGPDRKVQFERVIVPWLNSDPNAPAPVKDWFDMATQADLNKAVTAAVQAAIPDIAKAVLAYPIENRNPSGGSTTVTVAGLVGHMEIQQDRMSNVLDQVETAVQTAVAQGK